MNELIDGDELMRSDTKNSTKQIKSKTHIEETRVTKPDKVDAKIFVNQATTLEHLL